MDLNNSSEVIAAPDEYLSIVIVNLFIGIHIFIHYFVCSNNEKDCLVLLIRNQCCHF